MDNSKIPVDESVLTGAEHQTSSIDERTLAFTPAPVAASTIGRDRGNMRFVPQNIGGSFINSYTGSPESDDEGSSSDRSSLGLLPSNCFLGLSRSLLPLDTPALDGADKNVNSNNSRVRSSLFDSGSSKEQTSDSHEIMTTIKKCPPSTNAREEGHCIPQALFPSVEGKNDSNIDKSSREEDSKEQQFCNSRQHNSNHDVKFADFAGVLSWVDSCGFNSQTSKSRSDGDKNKTPADGDEQEDPDHTIHQVEFRAEDLKELEDAFSDFEAASSDEEEVLSTGKSANSNDKCGHQENDAQSLPSTPPKMFNIPVMDGPFKMPLPPKKPTTESRSDAESLVDNQTDACASKVSYDPEASIIFGDSIAFHQTGSTTDWGPSIQFGDSAHLTDTPMSSKQNSSKDMRCSGDMMDKSKFDKDCQSESLQHNDKPLQASINPFGDFGDENDDFRFNGEDFMEDSGAVAAMLDEDEEQFKKDNLIADEHLVNLTVASVRAEDQSFMNMTIGTYMAARSGELGSLTSPTKRPEFGMPVYSPPIARTVLPMLLPSEIYTPINTKLTRAKPKDDFGYLKKTPKFVLDESLPNACDQSKMPLPATKTPNMDPRPSGQQDSRGLFDSEPNNSGKPAHKFSDDNPADTFVTGPKTSAKSPQVTAHKGSNDHPAADPHQQRASCKSAAHTPPRTSKKMGEESHGYASQLFTDAAQTPPRNSKKMGEESHGYASQLFTDAAQTPPRNSKKMGEESHGYASQLFTDAAQTPPRNSKKMGEESHGYASQLFTDAAQDGTINSTSSDLTFSSLHRFLEGLDTNTTHPEKLILSEVSKKVHEKNITRQTKPAEQQVTVEHGETVDKPKGGADGESFQNFKMVSGAASQPNVQHSLKANNTPALQANLSAKSPIPSVDSAGPAASSTDATPLFKIPYPVQRVSPKKSFGNSKLPKLKQIPTQTGQKDKTVNVLNQGQSLPAEGSPGLKVKRAEDQFKRDSVDAAQTSQHNSTTAAGMTLTECTLWPDTSQADIRTISKPDSAEHKRPVQQFSSGASSFRETTPRIDAKKTASEIPQRDIAPQLGVQAYTKELVQTCQFNEQGHLVGSDETVSNDSHMTLESVSLSLQQTQPVYAAAEPTFSQDFPPRNYFKPSGPVKAGGNQNLQNETAESRADGEEGQFHSLMPDDTQSILHETELHNNFAYSTPMPGNQSALQKFTNMSQLQERSILPMVTPSTVINFLKVPNSLTFPDACCVPLSQQTTFPIINLLNTGVKCLLTIREVTFQGQKISTSHCPFEMKRSVVLSPSSTEDVQVLFRPKDQGEFSAVVEIFTLSLIRQQDNRTYTLLLSAYGEFPCLQISPSDDELNFGELLWGHTACRSIKIKNTGRATVPLRFSIFRKDAGSVLCNFSFHETDGPANLSMISHTTRPAAVGTVLSMSLPGVKEGKASLETVNVYCRAKEVQNVHQKYLENAEKCQAALSMGIDMPVEDIAALSEVKLQVTLGLYKLHVDKDKLSISAAPGTTGCGTIKIINSGNLPMPVDLSLEPIREQFSIDTNHVVVPNGGHASIQVAFTPQATREDLVDNKVNVMLQNALDSFYVSVTGKIKSKQVKISGSASYLIYGGVKLGQTKNLFFSFIPDDDVEIKIWIRAPRFAFKLMNQDGSVVESMELKVTKGKQYAFYINFTPTELDGYTGDLLLQILYANRFVIPMSGYGGQSNLKLSHVNQSEAGEWWLDMGDMVSGQSIIRKIVVSNTGVRSCFIKAALTELDFAYNCDYTQHVSGHEFQPNRGTIMPPGLLLPPGDSKELVVMLHPTQKEINMCGGGRALVAVLELMYGDEVNRQLFIAQPGKAPKHFLDKFDIPMMSSHKELLNIEMKNIQSHGDNYTLLKKSTSKLSIGVFGLSMNAKHPGSPTLATKLPASPVARSPAYPSRPVLTQVNSNISQAEKNKDEWIVAPSEIHLNVGDTASKDTAQVINFSSNEITFSVDCDENISVMPKVATVQSKATTMLNIGPNLSHPGFKESASLYGLVRVRSQNQIKYIKVYVTHKPVRLSQAAAEKHISPSKQVTTSFAAPFVALPSYPVEYPSKLSADKVSARPLGAINPPLPTSSHGQKDRSFAVIQASDMAIFPSTECGSKSYLTYTFTNIGSGPLMWEIASICPPYVAHANTTRDVYRVHYEVFKLHPLTGVLQPDETEKISIEFCPQSKGSFNQTWSIHDTAEDQVSCHKFNLYAKAKPNPHEQLNADSDAIPQGLSKTLVPSPSHVKPSNQNSTSTSLTPFTKNSRQDAYTTQQSPVPRQGPSAYLSNQENKAMCGRGLSWGQNSNTNAAERRDSQPGRESGIQRTTAEWTEVQTHSELIKGSQYASKVTRSSNSATSTSTPLSPKGGEKASQETSSSVKEKGLHITDSNIKFPTLHIQDSAILKVYLQNQTKEIAEVVVEYEPNPPFLIKHHSFKVGVDKMVIFPVTFKPRHIGHFKDKVVFREIRSGKTLTAFLDAQCEKKSL